MTGASSQELKGDAQRVRIEETWHLSYRDVASDVCGATGPVIES